MTDDATQPDQRTPALDAPEEVVAELDRALDAPEEVVAELDRLAAVSREAPEDLEANVALWRQVLRLERWIFIARGSDESPTPYAITLPQGPMVLAFTTAERARAAGIANGLSEAEAGRLLATPLPGAIEWAAALQGVGITALALDHGFSGPFAPLSNLVPMRDFFAANPV